jgi:virulence factor
VAVVGGGQMARRVFLPVLAARDDVELAVLVEPDQAARSRLGRVYRFGQTVDSIDRLGPGQADCALLLTPPDSRLGPFERLMELGLDVLAEKPMASDLAEAERMVTRAERADRVFMVGLNRRYMPCYLRAREFVAGRPLHTARVWKHGCKLWSHSLHVLDVLRWFCGEAVSVRAACDFDDGGRERAAAAIVRFDSGTIGLFDSTNHYGMRKDELEAHGEDFTVRVYAPDECLMYEAGREEAYRHGRDVWFMEAQTHYGFTAEVDHFFECVRTRATPRTAAAEALGSHRLARAILDAMGEG